MFCSPCILNEWSDQRVMLLSSLMRHIVNRWPLHGGRICLAVGGLIRELHVAKPPSVSMMVSRYSDTRICRTQREAQLSIHP